MKAQCPDAEMFSLLWRDNQIYSQAFVHGLDVANEACAFSTRTSVHSQLDGEFQKIHFSLALHGGSITCDGRYS